MFEWLALPISGAPDHSLPVWASWHGRAMVLAWGVCIPLGILVARYGKVTPRQRWPQELDNKTWWNWHRGLQYAGVVLALAALAIVYGRAGGRTLLARSHGLAGWTVMALAILQIVSAWLRGTKGGPTGEGAARGDWRGDHYDMTPRRLLFEYVHKTAGLLALGIAAGVVLAGLLVADAPRWMFVVILLWWGLLAALACTLQLTGRCIDTYQAIWGPDPTHPGNRRAPVGPGVRRIPFDTSR